MEILRQAAARAERNGEFKYAHDLWLAAAKAHAEACGRPVSHAPLSGHCVHDMCMTLGLHCRVWCHSGAIGHLLPQASEHDLTTPITLCTPHA